MNAETDAKTDILFEVRDGLGLITLNRPDALNALSYPMTLDITATLNAWRDDDAVRLVLLRGAGPRAFCAGGDIRHIYEAMLAGDSWPVDFWRDEYKLNLQIAEYQKPIVAVMHGFVMGGGVGLSAHASHRVVTESTAIAMPETSIGFLPDVGGSYLLPRAPGETGTHIALTAGRVGAADAIFTDLADVHIAGDRLGELEAELSGARTAQDVEARLQALASPAKPGVLAEAQSWIDAAYSADSVEEVVVRLRARPEPEAQKALAQIAANSPTSLKLALRALREGRRLNALAPCLAMELNVVAHLSRGADFPEGVRAAVIDKDRKPQWRPSKLEDVTEAAVEDYFRPWP
jgi:enoyl-CoA hydratase